MEILIVVALLGVLAAIVTVSILSMMGRGQDRGYDVDERNLQTAVSAFYADKHTPSAWYDEGSTTPDFVFSTWNGRSSELQPGAVAPVDGRNLPRLVRSDGSPVDGPDDVAAAAIWMGLLVNEAGSGTADTPADSAPLAGEHGLYINKVPESCSPLNYNETSKGTYTWIVGNYGRVYGVFEQGGTWYVGFNGSYP